MSSMAALLPRRAFAHRAVLSRSPPRRFFSTSKVEEAGLAKGPKRDPELYVGAILKERTYIIAPPIPVATDPDNHPRWE
jgi:hypothetical protein